MKLRKLTLCALALTTAALTACVPATVPAETTPAPTADAALSSSPLPGDEASIDDLIPEEIPDDELEEELEEEIPADENDGIAFDDQEIAFAYTPGTYEATVQGFGGPLTVTVTVDEDRILEVKVKSHSETKEGIDASLEALLKTVVDENSIDVEAISGATVSSQAVCEAISKALDQAIGA